MTENEMKKMQQEAIKRAQELQRRAVHSSAAPSQAPSRAPSPVTSPAPSREPDPPAVIPSVLPDKPAPGIQKPPDAGPAEPLPSGGMFEMLFRDKEKTLILGLILLLMDEKTDNGLLIALLYLLV